MKQSNLYIIRDVPISTQDCSNYHYVVKASSYQEAIQMVKDKTGHHDWDWEYDYVDEAFGF